MSAAIFDEKFGQQLIAAAPSGPGVYRYLDGDESVLYVGKAKNLRRRLSNYRNATRKKVHRKMRTLVREAHSLVYEVCESEQAALLREGELIRQLRPPYNVDGAYAFLYPSFGFGRWNKCALLCFSTHPDRFQQLDLNWYGCFRSRPRAKAAFTALVDLLSLVAHLERVVRLPDHPRIKGSRLVGLRQLPADIIEALPAFFAGEDPALPSRLARRLLNKPRARRDAAKVELDLKTLATFYELDAVRLHEALRAVGRSGTHVPQDERDALFIRASSS